MSAPDETDGASFSTKGAPSSVQGQRWFAGGVASWFGAFGMQQVLFSWIVVGELQASSEWVGVVQTSTMLPQLGLLLLGGAAADRVDPRTLLIRIHVVATLPILALAGAVALGVVTLPVLIAIGLCIGTVSAFAMPSRDALLSRVAGQDMMRAVTGMTAVQFGTQALGALLAGSARWTGSATMLVVQALILLTGSFLTRGIPAVAPSPRDPDQLASPLHEIAMGVRLVARAPQLRDPVLLVIAVGVLFIGPFLVVFPLLVRDYYQAGVDQLSIVLMLFPIGTITGSLVLRRFGIPHKGWSSLAALALGSATLAGIGSKVPFASMVALTLLWGLAGSVFINCSRTLFQEAAPMRERGRVMAVYQMGFMGGAPLGALLSGFLVADLGLHGTLVGFSSCMGMLVVAMALFSDLRTMR